MRINTMESSIRATVAAISLLAASGLVALAGDRVEVRGDGGKTVTVVDDQKRVEKVTEYNADGSVRQVASYEHDAEGRPTKIVYRGGDGQLQREDGFSYDAQGRQMQVRRRLADGSVWLRQSQYDESGAMKTQVLDPKGNPAAVADWEKSN